MNTKKLISISLFAVVLPSVFSQDKPNIIVILADDMGWGDAGCYGGKMIPTPNIDRLAKEGVRCTNGYVTAPISGPSRYGIFTGAYQQRFGIQDNTDAWAEIPGVLERIPASQKLLHETLKEGGYRTAIFGKYNLPGYPKSTFDETYSVMHFGGDYFPNENGHYKGVDEPKAVGSSTRRLWGPERNGDEYLTDRIGRQAVEFIGRNTSTPFFMYIGFNAPHSPMQAKMEHKPLVSHLQNEALQYYAAMLYSMDENVGRILKELDKQRIAQNTLIIFLSDNGPTFGYTVDWPKEWPKVLLGSAGNLSGHKGQLLEGGIREPYILRWSGKLKAGMVYDKPVSSLDIYPTVCAAANACVSKTTHLDGVNLLPFLQNNRTDEPHKYLFWYLNESGAVRSGKWKLNIKNKIQTLFNLEKDEAERNDLSTQEAMIKNELFREWQNFCSQMPTPCNQLQREKLKNKIATDN